MCYIWNRKFALYKSKICCSILSVFNPYETLTTYFKLYHVKVLFYVFFLFFFEGTAVGVIAHFFPLTYGFPFPPSSQNCNFLVYHVILYLAIMTSWNCVNESIYCIVIRNCNLSYSKTLNLCISQFYFIFCNCNMIFFLNYDFIYYNCYFISRNCDFVSRNFAIVILKKELWLNISQRDFISCTYDIVSCTVIAILS